MEYQAWPHRYVKFKSLEGLANTAEQFRLSNDAIYSCSILPGRERSEQFRIECETLGETPEENFGSTMTSSDGREGHANLLMPHQEFDRLYELLVSIERFEADIEFSITRFRNGYNGARVGLIDSDFRLTFRRLEE